MTSGDPRFVGRHGKLDLVFRRNGQKTFLCDAYATMPMHSLPPFYPDDSGCAHAYLVNPTGGLVSGDRIEIDIRLEQGSHAFLTTPSASRIYRSSGDHASQVVRIRVCEGAILEYLPGYAIPFAGSSYRQITQIRVERNATAFVLDSFVTGRIARGEHMLFREYASEMEIDYEKERIFLDRTILKPEFCSYERLGLLESSSAFASIFLVFDDRAIEKSLARDLHETMLGMEGVLGGVSALSSKGLIVRLLGGSMRIVEKGIRAVWSIARSRVIHSGYPLQWR